MSPAGMARLFGQAAVTCGWLILLGQRLPMVIRTFLCRLMLELCLASACLAKAMMA